MDYENYKKYEEILKKSVRMVECLDGIVKLTDEPFEGNCFYYHGTFNTDDAFKNKQINIMHMASRSSEIVEIGFNAGHSSLLMLLANSECRIRAIDICQHKYVKPCVGYLNAMFGDRITLYEGDSHTVLSDMSKNDESYKFDMIHIDGCHEYNHANIDFWLSKDMAQNGSLCMFDDLNISYLKSLWDGFVRDGHLDEFYLLDSKPHTHGLAIYKSKLPNILSDNIKG
jgi:hypothetical protein